MWSYGGRIAVEWASNRSLFDWSCPRDAFALCSDRKLTQLLRESLGGATCNTCAVVHVSPSSLAYNDTLQVMQLASRMHQTRLRRRAKVCCVKTLQLQFGMIFFFYRVTLCVNHTWLSASVCPSATLVYCIQTPKDIIKTSLLLCPVVPSFQFFKAKATLPNFKGTPQRKA